MAFRYLFLLVVLRFCRPVNSSISFTPSQVESLINGRRGTAGGSDMNEVKWDVGLEPLANEWAATCSQTRPSDPKFQVVGAMMFTHSVLAFNMIAVMGDVDKAFGTYKAYFDFSSKTCTTGKERECEIYKTVTCAAYKNVFCAILPIGCSVKLFGQTGYMCVFSPRAANDCTPPFTKGTSCTKCEPGRTKCVNGLCTPDDPTTPTTTSKATTSQPTTTAAAAVTEKAAATTTTTQPTTSKTNPATTTQPAATKAAISSTSSTITETASSKEAPTAVPNRAMQTSLSMNQLITAAVTIFSILRVSSPTT